MAASAMTVMLFPSCDKDDDGGSAGGFDVHVPSFVKGTTPIRVDLGVAACSSAEEINSWAFLRASATVSSAMRWALTAPLRIRSSTRITSMPASRSTRAS